MTPPQPLGRFVQALRASHGLGHLAAARVTSLASEGALQAALAGVVLFAPESAATPLAITAAFAVLVLPYSLIGPFASAALDRWDRRLVVAIAGAIRAGIIAVVAAAASRGAFSSATGLTAVFVLVLLALGLGRLINTGLTAALPHVVHSRYISVANSFVVTIGSLATAVGALLALLAVAIGNAENGIVAITLLTAIALSLGGSACVLMLARGSLGPPPRSTTDSRHWIASAYRTFAGGLRAGVRAASRHPLVWSSLVGIGLCRAAFGVTTLAIVLLFRDVPGPVIVGVGGFSLVMGMFAGGMGAAALIVPWALGRASAFMVNAAGALMAAISQLVAAAMDTPAAFVWCAFSLGIGSQMIKLVGDYAMQTDVPDEHRGAVFALQDAIFNATFVLGMAAVAWWIPATEVPQWLVAAVAAGYLIALVTAVRARPR